MKVGGLQSAIRAERSEAIEPRIARRRAEEGSRHAPSSASDDEVGGLQSAIRSERSEPSNTAYFEA